MRWQQRRLFRIRRSFASFSSKAQEDPALQWARQNPEMAQSCLHLPSVNAPSRSLPPRFSNFEEYWFFRGWTWPEENAQHAKTLVSHVLSAPLTVASVCMQTNKEETRRWCCIGARAEASLPVLYWREALLGVLNDLGPTLDTKVGGEFHLDFIGPEVTRHPNVTLLYHPESPFSLTLNWLRPGLFHQIMKPDMLRAYDGFILLNPGVGHPFLSSDWEPTLELLLDTGKCILVTAHSSLDVNREEECWQGRYGLQNFRYQTNPFASRLEYLDPLEDKFEHWVRPNFAFAFYDPSQNRSNDS